MLEVRLLPESAHVEDGLLASMGRHAPVHASANEAAFS